MTAKNIYKGLLGAIILSGIIIACNKQDPYKTDNRLDRRYCNDPDAVNYNTDFPGTPDNTICFYPTQLFRGTYFFRDTILDADRKRPVSDSFNIQLYAITNTRLALVGFCKTMLDTIKLTADRYYKAVPDSSTDQYNLKINGTFICGSTKDTLSGYMKKYDNDSSRILIRFSVATDTGRTYHEGTAIKL